MIYKLCYIEGNKAWFTSNMEKQWGDDWDDKPYEHNAGTPYIDYPQKIVYFDFDGNHTVSRPADGFNNSPYSVKDINNNRCPWLVIDDGNYIFAGTSYTQFIKKIENLGGIIYTPKRKGI